MSPDFSTGTPDGVLPPVPACYQTKVLARRHLLVGVGESAARFWADRGAADIRFLSDHQLVDAIVARYFAISLVGFKRRHRFLESERINNGKIAALLVRQCVADRSERLFAIPPEHDSVPKRALINGDFLLRLFQTILQVTPAQIKSTAPRDALMLQRDLRYCLTHKLDISEEWLSWAAYVYALRFGKILDLVG